jgi:glycosyltransferase involved in cell wall biosynthesis
VKAFNSSLVLFEMLACARGSNGWPKILARNRWFQNKVVSFLRSHLDNQRVLCSYSYTALEPFRCAKANSWKTVLLQIDPGPEEEQIVAQEAARVPKLAGDWQPAPLEYWNNWREECKLADRIIVNSEWSREGLVRSGVAAEKILTIPLAYEPGVDNGRLTEPRLQRKYPKRFTEERPLRVLFLGLVNLRKGVARLLETARILCDEPVEFWMVGPVEIANAAAMGDAKSVKWFGPVARNQATEYYRNADVFILPTLSDGFAVTQLEAQAQGLPLIVSSRCGDVIQHNINGVLLNDPSVSSIESAIRFCFQNPTELARFSLHSTVRENYSVTQLGERLRAVAPTAEPTSS